MRNDLQPTLGTAARAARNRLGLTQQDVADLLGVDVMYYARIDRGHAVPSVPVFARLVSILNVPADVLLGKETAHTPEPAYTPNPAPLIRPTDAPEFRELVMLICQASPRVVRLVLKAMPTLEKAVRENIDRNKP